MLGSVGWSPCCWTRRVEKDLLFRVEARLLDCAYSRCGLFDMLRFPEWSRSRSSKRCCKVLRCGQNRKCQDKHVPSVAADGASGV